MKHIKARYFFTKGKIAPKEIEVKHCPREQMWSGIMTKPPQGHQFGKMRAMMMNYPMDIEETEWWYPTVLDGIMIESQEPLGISRSKRYVLICSDGQTVHADRPQYFLVTTSKLATPLHSELGCDLRLVAWR